MMSAQDPRNKFKTSDYDQQEQESRSTIENDTST